MSSQPALPVAAPVVRPPLPSATARAARLAGGLGFGLMTVGWSLFALAGAIGLVWLLLSAVFAAVAQRDARFATQLAEVTRYLDTLPLGLIAGVLVVAVLLGAAIWTTGLLLSHRILRRGGHPHPWGVTWAGIGLGVVASGIATGVVQALGQVAGVLVDPMPGRDGGDPAAALVTGLGLSGIWLLVLLAVHVAAGVLLWWWMAWAMRPAAGSGAPRP